MNKQEFIKAIKQVVRDSAIKGCADILRNPPGRKPDRRLVRLSEWFNSLPADQQKLVAELVTFATDHAIFGFLCVLDGVRQIDSNPEREKLELKFTKQGKTVVLNDDSGDELHDLFKMETTE